MAGPFYVTVTGSTPGIPSIAPAPMVTFTPAGWVPDPANDLLFPPSPQYARIFEGAFAAVLLATDTTDEDWTWEAEFTGLPGVQPYSFSFALPSQAAAFTATDAAPCVFTASGTSYSAGQPLTLAGTALPGGFGTTAPYYVASPSGDAFSLAATSGGTALASTSAGSGWAVPVVDISALAQVPSVSPTDQYLPLTTGTPEEGQVPVFTGAGWATAPGTPGTVTGVTVETANGFEGTVADGSTTPQITLSTTASGMLKGAGGAIEAASAGTDYLAPAGSGAALTGITVSQVSGAAPLASPALTGTPAAPTASPGTDTTQLATTAYAYAAAQAAQSAAQAASTPVLSQTAVQTANYAASANQIVTCNTTGGAFTVQLPNAPANGTLCAVKIVILGAGNGVTVATQGSDVINKAGGGTSLSETLVNQGILLQYDSGIWVDLADDLPLSQLSALFFPEPSGTPAAGQYPAATGSGQASAWTTLLGVVLRSRGAVASATAYLPGDVVAYRGQHVLITTAVTSSAYGAWYQPPTLTSGTWIALDGVGAYHASDWGVVADGVTDNAPALNRALAWMWGSQSAGLSGTGLLMLPPGYGPGGETVQVGSTVILPPGCIIIGHGPESSEIRLMNGENCDVIQSMQYNSTSQAAILSAATGITIAAGSLRNGFYAGLINVAVHGNNAGQSAAAYYSALNLTTNPTTTAAGTDPDFDPYYILSNVELRSASGNGLTHVGRGGLRGSDVLFRYNNGWGAAVSFDSLYTGCNFAQNGIGGLYQNSSATNGAGCKSYNNGQNAYWLSGTAYAALTPVMYSGLMYRAINAVTSSTPPPGDTTNWAAVSATASYGWGYDYYFDSNVSEAAWSACDSQEPTAGNVYLNGCKNVNFSGVANRPNFNQATSAVNTSNPNDYAVVTVNGATGCRVDMTYGVLNSQVYALRALGTLARNDIRVTGDATWAAKLSPDSVTVAGTGSVVIDAVSLTSTLASQTDVSISSPGNGQLLSYNSTAGKWENSSAGGTFADGTFGDGSTGSATLDGTTSYTSWTTLSGGSYTMKADAFLTSLTVNSGVTLNTAGYRIFCAGTVTNNGVIANNGAAGSAGGTAGSGPNSTPLTSSPGSAGNTGNGTAGVNTPGNALGSGASGAGGAGSSGTAGAAASAANSATWPYRTPAAILAGSVGWNGAVKQPAGGCGGGGGGGDGTNHGGGGGAGGGIVALIAQAVVNNGTISAAGGNGGTPTAGNCGGGGPGGGGLILAYTLSAWTAGTTSVAAGTAGSGVGTGAAGTAGSSGSVLNVILQ